MEKPNLLIVDDDSDSVIALSRALKASGCEFPINGTTRSDQAVKRFLEDRPAVCLLDLCLTPHEGTASGFALLKEFLLRDPTVRVIILTGNGNTSIGVQALNQGAANFIEKPAELPHLLALIRDGVKQCLLKRSVIEGRAPVEARLSDLLIAESEAMKPVLELVYQASQTQQPVLITGETGTGKGLCASVIHKVSNRRNANFLRYQPSHGSMDLVMSDLFGHCKGAFTGADSERSGLIEIANGGTLFLDEIDELPASAQVALLGVLQDKLYRPLGKSTDSFSDFRLISATNRDPVKILESGKFRQDLFYRIAHLRIDIPPLRTRKADIPALARFFLREVVSQNNLKVFEIDQDAEMELLNFSWPGNVRELAARIEDSAYRATFLAKSTISKEILINSFSAQLTHTSSARGLLSQIEEYRYKMVADALQRNGENVAAAARELEVDRMVVRNTLRKHREES